MKIWSCDIKYENIFHGKKMSSSTKIKILVKKMTFFIKKKIGNQTHSKMSFGLCNAPITYAIIIITIIWMKNA